MWKASAKDGKGAGRGPCGLRNSELGPLPQNFYTKKTRLSKTSFFMIFSYLYKKILYIFL